MGIRKKSRNQLIEGLVNHTGLKQKSTEMLNVFLKRLLSDVKDKLSMQEIAELCSISKTIVWRAFKQYDIKSPPPHERAAKFSRVRAFATRKYGHKEKRIRGRRLYDREQVRKLMVELKSVKEVAIRLDAPKASIQSIISVEREKSRSWLTYRCEYCFTEFIPKVSNQKYCEKKCCTERKNYMSRILRGGLTIKHRGDMLICEICGNNIHKIEKRSDYQIKYCQTCRVDVTRRLQREAYRRRRSKKNENSKSR